MHLPFTGMIQRDDRMGAWVLGTSIQSIPTLLSSPASNPSRVYVDRSIGWNPPRIPSVGCWGLNHGWIDQRPEGIVPCLDQVRVRTSIQPGEWFATKTNGSAKRTHKTMEIDSLPYVDELPEGWKGAAEREVDREVSTHLSNR